MSLPVKAEDGAITTQWLSRDKTAKLIAAIMRPVTAPEQAALLDLVRRTIKHNQSNPCYFANVTVKVTVEGAGGASKQQNAKIRVYDATGKEMFSNILSPILFYDQFSGGSFNNGKRFSKILAAESAVMMNACLLESGGKDEFEQLLHEEHAKFGVFLRKAQDSLLDADTTGNARRLFESPPRPGETSRKEQPVVRPSSDPSRFPAKVIIKTNHASKITPSYGEAVKRAKGPSGGRPQTAEQVVAACEAFAADAFNHGLELCDETDSDTIQLGGDRMRQLMEDIERANAASVALAASSKFKNTSAPPVMLVPNVQIWSDIRGRMLPQRVADTITYDCAYTAVASCFFRLAPVSSTNIVPFASEFNFMGTRQMREEVRRVDPLRAAFPAVSAETTDDES